MLSPTGTTKVSLKTQSLQLELLQKRNDQQRRVMISGEEKRL
jgi:hypothetical protein